MIRVRSLLSALLAAASMATPARAQTFEVVDLGVLPGTNASYAKAINDAGTVVGLGVGDTLWQWQPGTGMRNLNAPNTLPNQELRINASGQVAGLWRRGGATYPFLWDTASFRELPQPSANWVQSVERLTNNGLVLYRGPITSNACPTQTAVLYAGAIYDFSTALGNCWDARDLDDKPRVAGSMRTSALFASFDATVWSNGTLRGLPSGRGYLIPNTFQRIGPNGHAAGQAGNTASRLFVLAPDNDYFEADSPNGGGFFVAAVNAEGEVVANSNGASIQTPYLVRNKRLINLTAVAPGFSVLYASDMNRYGHVAGIARLTNGEVHAVVVKPTDMPRAMQATGSGNQVTLAWTPPPAAPAGATYVLQVGSSAGAADLFKGSVGAVTSISGVVPNGSYYARVTMVYPSGAWSGVSQEVAFSVPTAPPAPTGLAFTLNGRTLSLTWTAPAGVSGAQYIAEAGSSSGGADIFVGNVGATPAIAGPVPPGTYFIRVRATVGGVASAPSNEVQVVVP